MLFARARDMCYSPSVLLSRCCPVVILISEGENGGDGIALTRSNGNCSVLVIPTFRGSVYDVVSSGFNEQ